LFKALLSFCLFSLTCTPHLIGCLGFYFSLLFTFIWIFQIKTKKNSGRQSFKAGLMTIICIIVCHLCIYSLFPLIRTVTNLTQSENNLECVSLLLFGLVGTNCTYKDEIIIFMSKEVILSSMLSILSCPPAKVS
jgi:hypothetical protein